MLETVQRMGRNTVSEETVSEHGPKVVVGEKMGNSCRSAYVAREEIAALSARHRMCAGRGVQSGRGIEHGKHRGGRHWQMTPVARPHVAILADHGKHGRPPGSEEQERDLPPPTSTETSPHPPARPVLVLSAKALEEHGGGASVDFQARIEAWMATV